MRKNTPVRGFKAFQLKIPYQYHVEIMRHNLNLAKVEAHPGFFERLGSLNGDGKSLDEWLETPEYEFFENLRYSLSDIETEKFELSPSQ